MDNEPSFGDYDYGYRAGVFDKCNGRPCRVASDGEDSPWDGGYLDGWHTNENQFPELEAEMVEPVEEIPTFVYHVSTERIGEVEAMFRPDGTLLGIWSMNDAHWRNEYFSPFMKELGIEIRSAGQDEFWEDKLIEAAKKEWGLSDFDVDPDY